MYVAPAKAKRDRRTDGGTTDKEIPSLFPLKFVWAKRGIFKGLLIFLFHSIVFWDKVHYPTLAMFLKLLWVCVWLCVFN